MNVFSYMFLKRSHATRNKHPNQHETPLPVIFEEEELLQMRTQVQSRPRRPARPRHDSFTLNFSDSTFCFPHPPSPIFFPTPDFSSSPKISPTQHDPDSYPQTPDLKNTALPVLPPSPLSSEECSTTTTCSITDNDDNDDDNSDSEWYIRQVSDMLTIPRRTSTEFLRHKSRPDSVCFPRSMISQWAEAENTVRGTITPTDPSFPRRQRRKSFHVPNSPPPPPPLPPVHPFSKPLRPCGPPPSAFQWDPTYSSRPPPRSSIPSDCVFIHNDEHLVSDSTRLLSPFEELSLSPGVPLLVSRQHEHRLSSSRPDYISYDDVHDDHLGFGALRSRWSESTLASSYSLREHDDDHHEEDPIPEEPRLPAPTTTASRLLSYLSFPSSPPTNSKSVIDLSNQNYHHHRRQRSGSLSLLSLFLGGDSRDVTGDTSPRRPSRKSSDC